MRKIIATLAVAGFLCMGAVAPAQAAPAPAIAGGPVALAPSWYVAAPSTCVKRGLHYTFQNAWWDPMGAFGTTRWVCYKKGEYVPWFY